MADPEVMRYRFATLSRDESDRLIDGNEEPFETNGFGLWAVERTDDRTVDIGWTLAGDAWGYGYATEAASASLDFAFARLGLDGVVAHTTHLNKRSQNVMKRLGLTHDIADDFDGPWYPPSHPYRRFVLYRLQAIDWVPR